MCQERLGCHKKKEGEKEKASHRVGLVLCGLTLRPTCDGLQSAYSRDTLQCCTWTVQVALRCRLDGSEPGLPPSENTTRHGETTSTALLHML